MNDVAAVASGVVGCTLVFIGLVLATEHLLAGAAVCVIGLALAALLLDHDPDA